MRSPADPLQDTKIIQALTPPAPRRAPATLVDDAWYRAVDDFTGRPRLTGDRFDLLMASAWMGVLLSTGRVDIAADPARHKPVLDLHDRIHADTSMRSVRGWLLAAGAGTRQQCGGDPTARRNRRREASAAHPWSRVRLCRAGRSQPGSRPQPGFPAHWTAVPHCTARTCCCGG
ncbi:hypothetical protein [Alloactinosynnema sp. L-07]|nr:hypothetical protein [Alloactinosynnema sp. L-07]